MKESQMINPNSLGHFHRDIKATRPGKARYLILTLSCGHEIEMTMVGFNKHFRGKQNATLCGKCSK